ncbi:MAG TPA: ribokinase [Patescibacteria group bacterium]|nr:ribokinase [Patescibacteria group bacterium]
MNKITVVGSFVMDLIGTMESFPLEGQTIIGKTFKTLPGGKGANQAVAASRLGGNVEMIGMVGNDAFGDTFKKVFDEEKITINHVLTSKESPTAVGLIQINCKGENKIVVIPGANYDYTIEALQKVKDTIKSSKLVLAQLELRPEVTFALIDLCHELGVPIVLNPAPAIPIDASYLKKVTYLTPNETELEIISKMKIQSLEDTKLAIQKLLDIGVKNVIATLGSKGALIGNESGFEHVPGYTVDVVDTVAAGDAFNGAFAYGVVEGFTLNQAVRYANAVGALTVTKPGAIPSLPSKAEVDKFIV